MADPLQANAEKADSAGESGSAGFTDPLGTVTFLLPRPWLPKVWVTLSMA